MLKKLFSVFAAMVFAVVTLPAAEARLRPVGPELSKLEWKPAGGYSRIETVDGRSVLVTDVPKDKAPGHHWFERELDLKPYRGRTITFFVRYRCTDVSKPPQPYNGVKFMLAYKPGPEAPMQWPGSNGAFGSTDGWQPLAFNVTFRDTAETGVLQPGSKDRSGRIEFDLDSLQAGILFSPEDRVNLDYKVKYPERIANHRRQRGVMSPGTIRPEDLKTLKEWNVNLIRAQQTRNWGAIGTEVDLAEYDQWLNGKLDNLEKAMDQAKEYDIKFVIDLHTPPGGKISSSNMRMFFEKKYADHFIEVWRRIAKRFKDHPQLYAYDLVNEPVQAMPAPYDYWNLQRMAAEAIREIDPDTPIMIESNESDRPQTYPYLSPLAMDNIIYKVHMYFPLTYTHQRLRGEGPSSVYPGVLEGEKWDKEKIRETLQPVRDFQLRHNAKIYVGEFSAIAWAPGAEKYINDCIEIFEEYGWDWTYHAFREWSGWSVEHEGTNPSDLKPAKEDTPRKKVLLKYFSRNR